MKLKLEVTATERTVIVAALMAYGWTDMAHRIARIDPTDDGPEVTILGINHQESWDA